MWIRGERSIERRPGRSFFCIAWKESNLNSNGVLGFWAPKPKPQNPKKYTLKFILINCCNYMIIYVIAIDHLIVTFTSRPLNLARSIVFLALMADYFASNSTNP